ncbi:MAG: hypothetical protein AAFY57_01355 [Cyanobacteria bacterium J06642_2]
MRALFEVFMGERSRKSVALAPLWELRGSKRQSLPQILVKGKPISDLSISLSDEDIC